MSLKSHAQHSGVQVPLAVATQLLAAAKLQKGGGGGGNGSKANKFAVPARAAPLGARGGRFATAKAVTRGTAVVARKQQQRGTVVVARARGGKQQQPPGPASRGASRGPAGRGKQVQAPQVR